MSSALQRLFLRKAELERLCTAEQEALPRRYAAMKLHVDYV
jgi:hypothetical protein